MLPKLFVRPQYTFLIVSVFSLLCGLCLYFCPFKLVQNMATKIILAWLVFLTGNRSSFIYYSIIKLDISSLSQLPPWFALYCFQCIFVMQLSVILTPGLVLLCCRSAWAQLKAFTTSGSAKFRVFIMLNLKLCWLRKGWVVCSQLLHISLKSLCIFSPWANLFSLQMAVFCFVHGLLEVKIISRIPVQYLRLCSLTWLWT